MATEILDKFFKNTDDNTDYYFSSEYHINNQRNDHLYDNTAEMDAPNEGETNGQTFMIWCLHMLLLSYLVN